MLVGFSAVLEELYRTHTHRNTRGMEANSAKTAATPLKRNFGPLPDFHSNREDAIVTLCGLCYDGLFPMVAWQKICSGCYWNVKTQIGT
ncbi:hypothetical protein GWI33_014604 [Rhynchophorus ferrugineus]|uniref:Uncharacterized protein n=1 Tax=Rhynchophorus ferrugineus TaxID=354439 RepID=A0A834IET1_RHYFE|nr:hypothetical protein GWI33_014604 [Rhynchophorus ferrugineus]